MCECTFYNNLAGYVSDINANKAAKSHVLMMIDPELGLFDLDSINSQKFYVAEVTKNPNSSFTFSFDQNTTIELVDPKYTDINLKIQPESGPNYSFYLSSALLGPMYTIYNNTLLYTPSEDNIPYQLFFATSTSSSFTLSFWDSFKLISQQKIEHQSDVLIDRLLSLLTNFCNLFNITSYKSITAYPVINVYKEFGFLIKYTATDGALIFELGRNREDSNVELWVSTFDPNSPIENQIQDCTINNLKLSTQHGHFRGLSSNPSKSPDIYPSDKEETKFHTAEIRFNDIISKIPRPTSLDTKKPVKKDTLCEALKLLKQKLLDLAKKLSTPRTGVF